MTKYSISRLGVIKNNITGHVLLHSITADGYPTVRLNGRTHKVHRLLAIKYIPNPHDYPIVKHLDDNKLNFELTNLCWDTQQQNCEDAQAKTYQMIHPNGQEITIYNMRSFCREHSLSYSQMYKVLSGRARQHHGYTITTKSPC